MTFAEYTFAEYTTEYPYPQCGAFTYSLVNLDNSDWSGDVLTLVGKTVTLKTDSLADGLVTGGKVKIKAVLSDWPVVAPEQTKEINYDITACVVTSIGVPAFTSTGSGTGSSADPYLYKVHDN